MNEFNDYWSSVLFKKLSREDSPLHK